MFFSVGPHLQNQIGLKANNYDELSEMKTRLPGQHSPTFDKQSQMTTDQKTGYFSSSNKTEQSLQDNDTKKSCYKNYPQTEVYPGTLIANKSVDDFHNSVQESPYFKTRNKTNNPESGPLHDGMQKCNPISSNFKAPRKIAQNSLESLSSSPQREIQKCNSVSPYFKIANHRESSEQRLSERNNLKGPIHPHLEEIPQLESALINIPMDTGKGVHLKLFTSFEIFN